ncbi:lysosomal amino acid transporter 1 homolog [Synchiropus splendidus]|uniref:lysosomal amino acid transporter 1 homolog n=1 Tax=Synchiropus splendidus TaxID=270530 RepID=UPI00237DA6C8|nr:lysosomal amino acid transporter 1 homolog [Synchiropus splendidus]
MATARHWKLADVAPLNWSSPALGPRPPRCVNGSQWILYLLQECVENTWEYLSVVVGLVSMLCFLLSTIPQVYEAHRNGKVEEAMSLGFLLCIFSGDLTSFAGGYLTCQLPIQIVAVVSYIITDLILISQFVYYKIKNSTSTKSPVLKWLCFLWCGAATLLLMALPKLITDSDSVSIDAEEPGASNSVEVSGYICGYTSAAFYLLSRFPQIHKNFQRQSTEGTSYMLFALAMMGNTMYGASVILVLPALRSSKLTFIIKHLAWLISSLGVLVLDLFITLQFIIYRKNSSNTKALSHVPEVEPLLCDEEEEELSVL